MITTNFAIERVCRRDTATDNVKVDQNIWESRSRLVDVVKGQLDAEVHHSRASGLLISSQNNG